MTFPIVIEVFKRFPDMRPVFSPGALIRAVLLVLTTGTLAARAMAVDPSRTSPSSKSPEEQAFAASEVIRTLAKVAYGAHPRQVLDFWQAPADNPTPLVVYIHGGGWVKDDNARPDIQALVAEGISVALIKYRYTTEAQVAGVTPPVEWPMHDAKRALQFVRSKAAEWNIDKQRVATAGQSAGACTSLWLALHDDMAHPNSSDPVARESTRPWCAAVTSAQTTLDPQQMKQWTPNSRYGGHAFGFMDPNRLETRDTRFDEFLAHRKALLPWIREYSPIYHATPDDPPIYLHYDKPAPALGEPQRDPTHTSNFGAKLHEKLEAVGVESEFVYRGAPDVKHADITAFLIDKLKK